MQSADMIHENMNVNDRQRRDDAQPLINSAIWTELKASNSIPCVHIPNYQDVKRDDKPLHIHRACNIESDGRDIASLGDIPTPSLSTLPCLPPSLPYENGPGGDLFALP